MNDSNSVGQTNNGCSAIQGVASETPSEAAAIVHTAQRSRQKPQARTSVPIVVNAVANQWTSMRPFAAQKSQTLNSAVGQTVAVTARPFQNQRKAIATAVI